MPDLIDPARAGDAKTLTRLLATGVSADRQNEAFTALAVAAEHGHAACIEVLLPHVDMNAPKAVSPLMLAVGQGHIDCVKLLLPVSKAGAQSMRGDTALAFAADGGHAPCVQLLLSHDDPQATDGKGDTALHHAARKGHVECVQLLIPVSAPGARNEVGETPLMHAAEYGRARCVELLLSHDNPNIQSTRENSVGFTALHLAVEHPDCLRMLLPVSDPRVVDKNGQNALMVATWWAGCLESVGLLLPHFDLLAKDHDGRTALALAMDAGNGACARILGEAEARLEAKAIQEAMREGDSARRPIPAIGPTAAAATPRNGAGARRI